LSYASGQVELINEPQLWAMLTYTILTSTVLYGFTANAMVARVTTATTPTAHKRRLR
jgi:hypothetical protein